MSDFEELDSVSESVLKDIIEHRESSYWKDRFSDPSEANDLWLTFEKLKVGEYITYECYDNFPARRKPLPRGENYFKDKEEHLQKMKKEKRIERVKKVLNYALWCIVPVIIAFVLGKY